MERMYGGCGEWSVGMGEVVSGAHVWGEVVSGV